jgi:hypothetical protein
MLTPTISQKESEEGSKEEAEIGEARKNLVIGMSSILLHDTLNLSLALSYLLPRWTNH